MSGGEIAALIAAGAFVLLVLLLAVPLFKLGRTLDEATLTIRQTREGTGPLLAGAQITLNGVNEQLEEVERHHQGCEQHDQQRGGADVDRHQRGRQPAHQGRGVFLRRAQDRPGPA